MKRNIKAWVVAVLVLGAQGLTFGHALAYNSPDKVSVKSEILETSPFPRSAMDD